MNSDLMSVEDAARRLGVNPQRVRALISNNSLPAQRVGRGYVLDSGVVAAFARRKRPRGRPISARNSWALLAALSGIEDCGAASSRSLDRLKSLLRQGSEAVIRAIAHAQPRSEVHAWRVLPVDVSRLMVHPALVRSGLAADHELIDVRYDAARDGLDAYVSSNDLFALERRLQPAQASEAPNLFLRVPIESAWILDEEVAPPAVAAADLLFDDDARVRRSANEALRKVANAHRDP